MSRIGKAPVTVPSGVTVTINGQNVEVKGPKAGGLSKEKCVFSGRVAVI